MIYIIAYTVSTTLSGVWESIEVRSHSGFIWWVLLFGLTIAFAISLAGNTEAQERPTGSGPYIAGFYETNMTVETSTDWFRVDPIWLDAKPPGTLYDIPVRVYYPATDYGKGAPPNTSGAPYVTVFFAPNWEAERYNVSAYREQIEVLVSHGMVVMIHGETHPSVGNDIEGLDHLKCQVYQMENLTKNVSSVLFGMIDVNAMGVIGNSWTAFAGLHAHFNTEQIGACVGLAPFSTDPYGGMFVEFVDMFDSSKVMIQVGTKDSWTAEIANRFYFEFSSDREGDGCVCLVSLPESDEEGPWRWDLVVAFLFYQLRGDEGYRTFVYGEEAVKGFMDAEYGLEFTLPDGETFPPLAHIEPLTEPIYMERSLVFNLTFSPYPDIRNSTELSVNWYVGYRDDIITSTYWSVSHKFPAPGNYSVSARWTIGELHRFCERYDFTVENEPPSADPGPDRVVNMDEEVLIDGRNSTDTPSHRDKLEFNWSFEYEGTILSCTESTYRITPTKEGELVARLTVRDPLGAVGRSFCTIYVRNLAPTVSARVVARDITWNDEVEVEEDEALSFKGMGLDTKSHINELRYRWDFGDGSGTELARSPDADHTYTKNGSFIVVLEVRDPSNMIGNDIINITVANVRPTGEIVTPDDGAKRVTGSRVDFSGWGNDTPSDIGRLWYSWDFGDGGTAVGAYVDHTYAEPGEYTVTMTIEDDDGANFVVTHNLTIEERAAEMVLDAPQVAAVAFVVVAVLGVAFAATTEPGKYWVGLLGAPMFTKVEDVLDNKTRYALHGVIVENPGIHYSAIKEEFGLANGQAAYHLDVLERESFIRSVRDGKLKRFYSARAKVPRDKLRSPDETREDLVDLVRRTPGISQLEVIEELGLERNEASYYLRDLVKEGRLLAEREGKYTVYHVKDRL